MSSRCVPNCVHRQEEILLLAQAKAMTGAHPPPPALSGSSGGKIPAALQSGLTSWISQIHGNSS